MIRNNRIKLISSIAAELVSAQHCSYNITKSALETFVKTQAVRIGKLSNVFSGENPGGSKNQKKRNYPVRKPPVYTPHPDAVLKIVPISNSLIICKRGK